MNAPTTQVPAVRETHSLKEVAIAQHGLGAHLVPQSMADVVRFADTMAKGAIALPKHLRGDAGACLAVTLQALDWGMNPIAVANKSYSVNDRLAYEAQLIAAVIHARAPIKGRPRYAYTGEAKTTRQCTVAVTTTDGEVLEYTSPEVGKITTKNSPLWKSDEDQQLGYFSIRSLARRHFPELLLGVYDREEAVGMRDVTPRQQEPSGLAARLAAGKATAAEGFTAATAEQTPHDPETGEVVEDGAQDAHFTDASTGEGVAEIDLGADTIADGADDDFPGDHQATAEPDGFDATEWAAEQSRLLETFETAADLDAHIASAESARCFGLLQAASPGLATSLNAAVRGRRKALIAKEVG